MDGFDKTIAPPACLTEISEKSDWYVHWLESKLPSKDGSLKSAEKPGVATGLGVEVVEGGIVGVADADAATCCVGSGVFSAPPPSAPDNASPHRKP